MRAARAPKRGKNIDSFVAIFKIPSLPYHCCTPLVHHNTNHPQHIQGRPARRQALVTPKNENAGGTDTYVHQQIRHSRPSRHHGLCSKLRRLLHIIARRCAQLAACPPAHHQYEHTLHFLATRYTPEHSRHENTGGVPNIQ